jgi:hypothetical protein
LCDRFTHDTGPAECVRPAVGLGRRENCNTKWGERGKGFFRESQYGQTVAAMGRIYAANGGTRPASVQIARGEHAGKRQSLASGEVKLL